MSDQAPPPPPPPEGEPPQNPAYGQQPPAEPPAYGPPPTDPPAYGQQPGYGQQPAYGQPAYGAPYGAAAPVNTQKATWALVLGILSLLCCGLFTGIPAIIMGKSAKEELEALALSSDKVQRALDGAEVKKVIVVPDRLVNLVA